MEQAAIRLDDVEAGRILHHDGAGLEPDRKVRRSPVEVLAVHGEVKLPCVQRDVLRIDVQRVRGALVVSGHVAIGVDPVHDELPRGGGIGRREAGLVEQPAGQILSEPAAHRGRVARARRRTGVDGQHLVAAQQVVVQRDRELAHQRGKWTALSERAVRGVIAAAPGGIASAGDTDLRARLLHDGVVVLVHGVSLERRPLAARLAHAPLLVVLVAEVEDQMTELVGDHVRADRLVREVDPTRVHPETTGRR